MLNLPLTHDFTGKVVVVTGAGGVLCGDMARAYAQAGAKVAALDPLPGLAMQSKDSFLAAFSSLLRAFSACLH